MLNNLIDDFIKVYNTDVKQRDSNWYKLMGTTVGGSEVAALMGLSPYSNFYKVVESKIDICKGNKPWNSVENLSCWWGTLFEDIITRYVEIDLGNQIKGTSICIQKYEGHRNSPDGYIVANFYYKDNKYHLWTTDLPNDIIEISMILLLEFKCPITRRVTGDIPKYYKPQVLSGLSVSPLAHKGLFVDAVFRKCSINQLGNNPQYDTIFHKKINNKEFNPIAWGAVTVHIQQSKDTSIIKNIYEECFGMDYVDGEENDIIDLGDISYVSYDIFNRVMSLINDKELLTTQSTVQFADGRGDDKLLDLRQRTSCFIFAILPWKVFDVSYVPVDREPNFLENIYPIIQRVHEIVKESLTDPSLCEKLKIADVCDSIYE